MKTYAIGIDLGATTIKAGIVNPNGILLEQIVLDSKALKGPAAVIKQILFAIEDLLGRHKSDRCLGIGIGAPGIVSAEEGIVSFPPNFADWTEVDLKKSIAKVFSYPISIENDANVAALAEARYGLGIQYKDFIFVIWGTGVGGGIIMNRKLYRGSHGGAGEIGHISINYEGPQCNCGNKGCIESFVGQRYLSQRAAEYLQSLNLDKSTSKILELVDGDLRKIDPAIIASAAEEEDPTACEILRHAAELLGYALTSVVNILDIRVIIIGGGLSGSPKFVFAAIEESIRSRTLKTHKQSIRVLRSNMGNNAGMIGAANLILSSSYPS